MDDMDDHKDLWHASDDNHRIIFLRGEITKIRRDIAKLYDITRHTLNFEKLEKSIKFWGGLIAATIVLITFLSQAMNYFNNLHQLQKQQLSLQERQWEEEHDRYRPTSMPHRKQTTPYYYDILYFNIEGESV